VPRSLVSLLDEIEALAAYGGAWRPLRQAIPALRDHLAELRVRAGRLDDVLILALVGGSGVGKSTLLNALAGDQLAETSELRPCTAVPTVYHPPGALLDFGTWRQISGSALSNLAIVDTPDSDTVLREHRDAVIDVLGKCDVVVICGSAEKYLDEATWSLVRPLRGERTLVCVETKARAENPSVRDHWIARLAEHGLAPLAYFRVNALRALDAKLAGTTCVDDGSDFARLETFLREELDRERIRRIKRSNVAGLLRKTVAALEDATGETGGTLERLAERMAAIEGGLARHTLALATDRVFAEPHLWRFSMGRESAIRSKGIVGNLFRLLEGFRTLPARIAGWIPWAARDGAGQRAAALLADRDLLRDETVLQAEALKPVYDGARSEAMLALTQAGFEGIEPGDFDRYQRDVAERIAAVLRGPARGRLVQYARAITSWPVSLLADAPVVAFIAFFGYKAIRAFFSTQLLTGAFFIHAASVLAVILLAELLALSFITRALAWAARNGALRALQSAMTRDLGAFAAARVAIDEARAAVDRVVALRRETEV